MTVQLYAKILAHPIREKILRELLIADDDISPRDLAPATGETLGTVSYHIRLLAGQKAIRKTRQRQVRGAIQHYYRITDLGLTALQISDLIRDRT